jgi:hypothetical protein
LFIFAFLSAYLLRLYLNNSKRRSYQRHTRVLNWIRKLANSSILYDEGAFCGWQNISLLAECLLHSGHLRTPKTFPGTPFHRRLPELTTGYTKC